jgi:ribosomal biogenesis protein LAS1
MRLPRRVPWTFFSELDQVCSWIYEDENDIDSKVLAVNRVSLKTTHSTVSDCFISCLPGVQSQPSRMP